MHRISRQAPIGTSDCGVHTENRARSRTAWCVHRKIQHPSQLPTQVNAQTNVRDVDADQQLQDARQRGAHDCVHD